MKELRHRIVVPALAGAVVWASVWALGCGSGPRRRRRDPNTMIVLYPSFSEEMFNPSWDMPERWMVWLPLALPERGEMVGYLAKSWTASDGGRTWTIRLRDDARWQDGVPVTAEDARFTQALWDASGVDYWLSGLTDSVVVVDAHTFRIYYKVPRQFTNEASYYPKHLLEGKDPHRFYDWEFWKEPVGDGPYRWVRTVPKTMMEFEAVPDYPGGRPAIDRIIVRFGGANPVLELEAGDADVWPGADAVAARRMAKNPEFRVIADPALGWFNAVLWNEKDPRFRDVRVRRALTLALDRTVLNRAVYGRDGVIADGLFPQRDYWRGELPEPLPYDTARAIRLLEEAGWRDADGDGVREREGVPLHFTLLFAASGAGQQADERRFAVLIQSQLRRVGAEVELMALSGGSFVERKRAGDFQAALERLRNFPEISPSIAELVGPGSPIGYRSPALEALLDSLSMDRTLERTREIHRRVGRIMAEEMPVTLLGTQIHFVIAHRRIHGLEPGRADPLADARNLWIEEEGAAAAGAARAGERPR